MWNIPIPPIETGLKFDEFGNIVDNPDYKPAMQLVLGKESTVELIGFPETEWVSASFGIHEHPALAAWLNEIKAMDCKIAVYGNRFYVFAQNYKESVTHG